MKPYHKKQIRHILKNGTNGFPISKGMVVFNETTLETGLVGGVSGECISVPVRMTAARKLLIDDVVMLVKDCREADVEQKSAVQRLLNGKHLIWDRRKGALSESVYVPKDGQQVKVSLLDNHIILGAFKEIDRKGNLVLYCLMEEDGTLRYSLHEEVGIADNLQVTPIGTSARSRFADALHREGFVWNGRLKRLEPLEMHINRGGRYYYLNDVLEIRECMDNNRRADRKRLECGNYFRERKDAELVSDCVRSIVKLNRDKDVRR